MKSFKMTLTTALGIILATTTSGFAAWTNEFRSNASTNMDWETAADWERLDDSMGWLQANVPPVNGSIVTIRSGDTVGINSTTDEVADLTIQSSGGVLSLHSAAVLKVRSNLTINGVFEFNDPNEATPPTLQAVSGALTIQGNVQTVSGSDEGGIIAAAAGSDSVYLASGTVSCQYGPVLISAPFKNDGVCQANGGTSGYDITFTGVISNSSVGKFEVIAANAKMIFNHDVTGGAPSLSGSDFHVSAGEMRFMQSLTTAGGVKLESITGSTPKIKADVGKTFTATGAY